MRIRVPLPEGELVLTFQTRHLEKGFKFPIPGQLWVDAQGPALRIEEAVTAFGNAAASITPIISLATNASVGNLEPEIAFDQTPGLFERQFLQIFVPEERGLLSRGRPVDKDCVRAVIASLEGHKERDRLLRAITQYHLSLKHWRLGHEILATSHLYMGIETLTKAVIRMKFGSDALTEEDIAKQLGIAPTHQDPFRRLSAEIESAVRSKVIFAGDTVCYRSAKTASDSFEHGFMPFDKIREASKGVRDKTAGYLRKAILDLLPIAPELLQRMTQTPFDQPLGDWPAVKYLRGILVSSSDALASPTNEYPIVAWRTNIKSVEMNDKGEYMVQFEEKISPQLAEGASLKPLSVEIWAP